MSYIYLYGMVLATESFLIKGEYPKADSNVLLQERNFHIGVLNRDLIRQYFAKTTADISELKESAFEGVVDYMIIAGQTRTGMGFWDKYYSRTEPWYEPANEESIKNCCVAALDPFFGDEGAYYCQKYGKKFVTMDSPYDSIFTKACEVIAISHEYLDTTYPGISYEELHKKYTSQTNALVIFTMGSKPVLYGRKGEKIHRFSPYHVPIQSTLGAGDSFKAGATYALKQGYNDDDIVKTACAIAAATCMHYPIARKPPTLTLVNEVLAGKHNI